MSIRKNYKYFQFFAALLMLVLGILMLTGCAKEAASAVFPEEISTNDIVRSTKIDSTQIKGEDFIQNPNGLQLSCEITKAPDLTGEGIYEYEITVKAENGAKKTFTAKLTLYKDDEAPVISGVADKRFCVTDKVSYVKGVTAIDNHDGEVQVNVDNSALKFDENNQVIPGAYKIIYTAVDQAGNEAKEEATFYFNLENITDEMIDKAVAEVLAKYITPDMSPADKAWVIYLYTYRNINYTGSSDKSDYRAEAYRGITNKEGDCFTYYAVAKALLLASGVTDIIDVERADGGPLNSSHYWLMVNLGSGYYHFDSTRKHIWQDGFMQTDIQLDAYEESDASCLGFFYRDKEKYPQTPMKAFVYSKDYNLAK